MREMGTNRVHVRKIICMSEYMFKVEEREME